MQPRIKLMQFLKQLDHLLQDITLTHSTSLQPHRVFGLDTHTHTHTHIHGPALYSLLGTLFYLLNTHEEAIKHTHTIKIMLRSLPFARTAYAAAASNAAAAAAASLPLTETNHVTL